MADIQLRFKQLGGAHDFTVPVADMADYPIEQDVVLSREVDATWGGRVFTYQKYKKKRWLIHFTDITALSLGSLGSIAQQTYDTAIYYGTDVANQNGLYGTCYFAMGNWSPKETALGLSTVDMLWEQITSDTTTDGTGVGTVKLYEATAYSTPIGTMSFVGTASGITIMNNDSINNGRMFFNFDGGTIWFPLPGLAANWHRETNVSLTKLYNKADSGGTVPFDVITVE